MKTLVAIGLLAACNFKGGGESPNKPIDAPVTMGDDDAPAFDGPPIDEPPAPIDGPCEMWPYDVSNFDPCQLPVAKTIDFSNGGTFNSNTATGGVEIAQGAEVPALLVHLTAFDLPSGKTLAVTGTRPVIFAVDGMVSIAGTINVTSGPSTTCNASAGGDGTTAGGGGGGGAGGASNGGDGTDGNGGGHGTHGKHGDAVDHANVTPLVGGCRGGNGGAQLLVGGGDGGVGGGALQISSKMQVTVGGSIKALGGGGKGGFFALGSGGGGGGAGAGGAILLEGTQVALNSSAVLCSDGGSGGEGYGGKNGSASPCSGTAGATTSSQSTGGDGGDGGFAATNPTNAGGAGTSGAAGGGGGGAAGFIRLRVPGGTPNVDGAAVVTPAPKTN